MFVNKDDGSVAKLLEQTERGTVVYSVDGGKAVEAPSHVFFAAFREATREEVAKVEAKKASVKTDAEKKDVEKKD